LNNPTSLGGHAIARKGPGDFRFRVDAMVGTIAAPQRRFHVIPVS
jgi:hypothetical protein